MLVRSLSFLLVFAATSPAAAKSLPTRNRKLSDAKSTAVSVSSATAFVRTSTAALTVEEVLSQFERYDRELQTLSADFSQTLSMKSAGLRSSIEGTVAYRKPERLRIEHMRPERQTVVCDGKNLWIYRKSQNQAIQSSLNDWRQADPALDNLLQFGSYSAVLKRYDAALEPGPVLRLQPKPSRTEKSAPFELRLTLAPDTLFPIVSELSVEETRIRTQFENVRFNPQLEDAAFTFAPPAGVDVFKNFKPPKL